jgi:alpha-tubulin suppressor-like RCC1 family protein
VGTESKSVEYVAGTNDAGQCISSSTGKLYRNGVEVTTGTVKAVKGDKYVLGLTAATASTVNGFIQRTATSAGLCAATRPTAGIIRLNKHSANFIETSSSTIIAAVGTTEETIIYDENGFDTGTITGHRVYLLKSNGSLYTWSTAEPGKITKLPNASAIKNITIEDGKLKTFSSENTIEYKTYYSINNTYTLKIDGSIWTRGENSSGQLGDGTTAYSATDKNIGTGYKILIPIKSTSGNSGELISLMGIKLDGSLWAWGENRAGQLGDGTKNNILSPKKIDDGYSKIEVNYPYNGSSGYPPSYIGIKLDGSIWTWGISNKYGELGTGSTAVQHTPKKIGADYLSVKYLEGRNTFIAKKKDGTNWAWGKDADYFTGKSGDSLLTPTQIDPEIVSIDFDGDPILATKKDGAIWGWSNNEFGQLGDETYTPSTKTPTLIGGGFTRAVACNDQPSAAAIKQDGTLWTWGNLTATKNMIGAGYSSLVNCGLALKPDGTLWGWGDYAPGYSSVPVKIVLP